MQVRSRYQTDVKNYISRVRLHSIPRGLLPGMTARVEILTARKPDALVIPPAALAVEDGQTVCYVADGSSLRRREIEIGEILPDRLEILAGLAEGERVVASAAQIDTGRAAPLADFSPTGPDSARATLGPNPPPPTL
jgi:multidrug efflux pump subunit AcrA (membrane-fusion protein)